MRYCYAPFRRRTMMSVGGVVAQLELWYVDSRNVQWCNYLRKQSVSFLDFSYHRTQSFHSYVFTQEK